MTEKNIIYKIENNVATIIMNRPEVHNAFNENMIAALSESFKQARDDNDVRAIILRGNGKSFSAGGDLNWMRKTAEYTFEENIADAMNLGQLLKLINFLPKPTIALVHGNAFGGGVGLAACCDIVISEIGTKFCLSEVRIGLIPSIIEPYVMAAIGERQTRRYCLTAEKFDADKAKEINLVHEVTAKGEMNSKLEEIISALHGGSPSAQSRGKKVIMEISKKEIDDEIINFTVEQIAEARASDDGKEGLSAFLNKSQPWWQKK